MIGTDYISLSQEIKRIDLDDSIDLVNGYSSKRKNWKAIIIFDPIENVFVELRDGPEDIRGYCKSEAEEVTESYIVETYNVTDIQLKNFKSSPAKWKFINARNQSS